MTDDVLLGAGTRMINGKSTSLLVAVRIKDGTSLWHRELTAPVVKGGIAIDRKGRIVVTLENGKIVCMQ